MPPVSVRPRINHIVLRVRDLDRAVGFYTDVFDYEECMERFGDGSQAFLRARGSDNHHDLGSRGAGPDAPRPAGGAVGLYHFALEVPTLQDLVAIRARLAELQALTAEFDTGATLSVYGRDPDGATFEVMWETPRDSWGEFAVKGGARPLDLDAALAKWGGRS
jgi:catechol-2,3-dioxygenase